MKTFNEVWDVYRTSWNNFNSNERMENLQGILTDDFEYRDPNFEIKGDIQLSEYMQEFQKQFEGCSFVTRNIEEHHNRCLVHWDMINDNKEVVSNGISFVLHENNKLKQITGFFSEN